MNTLGVILLVLRTSLAFNNDLVITTTKGKVCGITLKSTTGKEVDAWYGIPYAEKPLGNFRFKPPVPAKSWHGILETHSLPYACVQIVDDNSGGFPGITMWLPNTPVSEDCLYINVVVPKPRPQNATVMVWIYGGGFISGSSVLDIYDSKTLVSEENVIVVSMQYRLGALGFLYLGNSEAPGNAGFLDQVLALQWVQDNIAAFGGNPEDVTLFGESAGAVSVSHHIFSSLSKNLFKRGIMQSGSIFADWAIVTNKQTAIERGLALAKELRCPHDVKHISKTISCLKKANVSEMIYGELNVPVNDLINIPFRLLEDGEIITDPFLKLANKDFKQGNILLGANGNEGNYLLMMLYPHIFKNEENITLTYQDFVDLVQKIGINSTEGNLQTILQEYTNSVNLNDSNSIINIFDKIVGDQLFSCPTKMFADVYAESGNVVYFYHYLHKSDRHYWPKWSGTLHADEIAFVFGEPMKIERGYSPDQINLSKRMMKYWSNFAKTGNPNKPSDVSQCSWPSYTVDKRAYLNLDVNHCSITGGGLRTTQCELWINHIRKMKVHKIC